MTAARDFVDNIGLSVGTRRGLPQQMVMPLIMEYDPELPEHTQSNLQFLSKGKGTKASEFVWTSGMSSTDECFPHGSCTKYIEDEVVVHAFPFPENCIPSK